MNGSRGNFISGLIIGIIIAAVAFFALTNTDLSQDKAAIVDTGDGDVIDDVPDDDIIVGPVDMKVTNDDHIRGNADAPITIVEYSDFQCPFCSRFHDTMKQAMAQNDNVRWVYRHFPLSFHDQAQKSAEASECAADQGKFWEYADLLYESQADLPNEPYSDLATKVGLDISAFEDCLDSGKHSSKVTAQFQQGVQDGVKGTPGGFINGVEIGGAVPLETIQAMIDAL